FRPPAVASSIGRRRRSAQHRRERRFGKVARCRRRVARLAPCAGLASADSCAMMCRVSHPVIHVSALTKRFGETLAVDAVDFDVPAGATAALLGGNGAGKTTTLSMLLGLLLPTAGQISIFGEDMLRHRYRVLPRMNFSSPYVDLPHRLTVRQNLVVYGRLYGIAHLGERIATLAEDLQI